MDTVYTKGRTLMRARTTPSAGALYPLEVLVACKGRSSGEHNVFLYDISERRLDFVRTVNTQVLAQLRPGEGEVPHAIVIVLGRPWKSMLKYGNRGYLYTRLDGAHATSNIALSAMEAGLRPAVHLRFDRALFAEALGLDGLCREPQALVTLMEPETVPDAALPPLPEPKDTMLERPGVNERRAWYQVSDVSTCDTDPSLPPRLGPVVSIAEPAAEGDPVFPVPDSATPSITDFRTTAVLRASAKGFLPVALDADAVARLLVRAGSSIPVDCADGEAISMRALVRNVTGSPAGVHVYSPERRAAYRVGDGTVEGDAVVSACMGQEVVRDCALLIALYAPGAALLGEEGRQRLAEYFFHAGSVAQRLCLAAADLGLGITCLGGFDDSQVAELVRLDPGEEVLYVLAVGTPDGAAVKWDRAPVAHSHQGVPPGT
ncbi:nitroreductase family protein [Nocardiopsis sp. LOL_012]|uniref:nitroreductase family protein n=1 Tax=Nocardiopsis sp. LOL_012 TaxID=3345409 RepID=UPI003A85F5DE